MPESTAIEVKLLKAGVLPGDIQPSEVIPAAGLTRERLTYLYKFIKRFVIAPYKDAVAPSPDAEGE